MIWSSLDIRSLCCTGSSKLGVCTVIARIQSSLQGAKH